MNQIARIREELKKRGLDAVLVTDEKNQRYAAGFPFTDGAVLVGREKAPRGPRSVCSIRSTPCPSS